MKKTRMSIDDIHAMVGSIRKNVLNMRVTNIYDLASSSSSGDKGNKTYILKLHQPPFPKVFLLLESGVRFHTSKYARDASSGASLPSQFTMKLRKHLRGKRLTALTQLEGDRVVDLTFGSDALQCHLILELYASGNIVLTDENYTILSLLRTHKFDDQVKMAVKQVYPVSVLSETKAQDTTKIQSAADLIAFADRWFTLQEVRSLESGGSAKKPKPPSLKQLLLAKESTFGGLGPVIVEHCIVSAGLNPSLKLKSASDVKGVGVTELARLVQELHAGWTLLAKLQTDQVAVMTAEGGEEAEEADEAEEQGEGESAKKGGYIVLKDDATTDQFEEFTPFLYAQHRQKRVRAFATFDDAVDEYFSHFEAQSAEAARAAAKLAAATKLDKLRKSQRQQIDQLVEVQAASLKQAQLLEAHQQDVENVLLVVRSALASGMDWRGLEELVRFEQRNGNPVASLIHALDLAHNRVAILLCDVDGEGSGGDGEEEEDIEDAAAHVIWIDLSLSALANAREIYAKKKKTSAKVAKATDATDRAIAQAQRATQQALAKHESKRAAIYARRKTLWFEKFHWFLTSENYLVLAGKDAHQNELLVKRYLRRGDAFVHADLHGAATTIVRNRGGGGGGGGGGEVPPIPVASLEQAGAMSVCRSNAWTNQVVAGAYWVHADQVSKTAPAGEYLSTGSFMIRGKKNYITPSRLEMGLAIVFRVDDGGGADDGGGGADDGGAEGREGDDSEDDEGGATVEEPVEEEEEEVAADDAVAEEDVVVAVVEPPVEEPVVTEGQKEEVEEEKEEEEQTTAAVVEEREGRKRLTAKQRRDLKKGKPIDTVLSSAKEEEEERPPAARKKGGAEGSKPTPSSAGNVRGKKGKLKKLKKKYADQDEEDRRLRMEALGHALPPPVAEDEGEQDEEEGEEEGSTPSPSSSKPPEATDEYIRQQREKKEKYLEQEEEEVEALDFFDAFTGAPLPHASLLCAVPMCAPYAALGRHKYKVKLTPGSVKKGKAAKAAMEFFFAANLKEEKTQTQPLRRPESERLEEEDTAAASREAVLVQRELMRQITDNELVACLVGPVKITAPGMQASSGSSGKKPGKKGGKK